MSTENETPAGVRRPLKKGTVLDYCGMLATVVDDDGGPRLTVSCEGHVQRWNWTFEGVSCKVLSVPPGEHWYDSFEAYVQEFPPAESYRRWLTQSGRRDVVLVRACLSEEDARRHNTLPGGYLWLSRHTIDDLHVLAVHDSDDGVWTLQSADAQVLDQALENAKHSAPLTLREYSVLGFAP